jgi:hypothetical protein
MESMTISAFGFQRYNFNSYIVSHLDYTYRRFRRNSRTPFWYSSMPNLSTWRSFIKIARDILPLQYSSQCIHIRPMRRRFFHQLLLRLDIEYNDLKNKANWGGSPFYSYRLFFIKAKDNALGCEEEPERHQTVIITVTVFWWNSGAWLLIEIKWCMVTEIIDLRFGNIYTYFYIFYPLVS